MKGVKLKNKNIELKNSIEKISCI